MNRMMLMRLRPFFLPLILLSIFFTGMLQGCREDGAVLENKYLKVALMNPEHELGCRFTCGGWIKNICLKGGSKKGLLVDKSIFSDHPAFGFTEEFFPPQKLMQSADGKSVFAKIGVGKVLRPGESRFKERPLQHFPWSEEESEPGDPVKTVRYRQIGSEMEGFNFTLTKTVSLGDESAVVLTDMLENTGEKRLVTQVYIHPFFTLGGSPADCWYTVPALSKAIDGNTAVPLTSISCEDAITLDGFPKEAKWAAVGNRKTGEVLGILSDTSFDSIVIWKSKTCFAVEPFIDIDLAPGEKQSWQWRLIAGRGLSTVSGVGRNGLISIERSTDGISVGFLPVRETEGMRILMKILDENGVLFKEYAGDCPSAAPDKPAKIFFAASFPPGKGFYVKAEISCSGKIVASAEERILDKD